MQKKNNYRLRYAPSLSVMGQDIPIDRQLRTYAEYGIDAVEYSCAGQPGCGLILETLEDVSLLRKKLDLYNMEMGVFVANPDAFNSSGLCNPDHHKSFLFQLNKAIRYHKVIRNHFCTLLVGAIHPPLSRDKQKHNVVEGLKRAADVLEGSDLTLVVEPINLIDVPNSFLVSSDEAAEIVAEVNSYHIKILFDIYHQQLSAENIVKKIQDHNIHIGYYQSADVPGRREPGTGQINWHEIFRTIYETGYRGLVGMEHQLSLPGEFGLRHCLDAYRRVDAWKQC